MKPKHGQERNQRLVSSWHGKDAILPNGEVVKGALGHGHTETRAEQYCAYCNEWIDHGFLGFLACPKCKRPW